MATDQARSSLELLYHISRELASALDLRAILQRVLYLSMGSVGGERGSVIVLDDQGQPVDAAIVYGAQLHSNTTQQLRDTLDKGLAGWVMRHREAVLIADTSKDERWLRRPDDALNRSGAKAAICLPLLVRERLVGTLTLVHPVPGSFSEEHLALMQAISDQAAVAVLNARLYAESQRQARVMTALAENAVTINASLRLEEVLQRIMEHTRQALQVQIVLLGLVDTSHRMLEFRAVTGEESGSILGLRRPLNVGLIGKVFQEDHGVIATRDQLSEADRIPGIEIQALACAPVHAHGRIIGVLQAIDTQDGNLDPDAGLVISGISSLAGTAIQNAQLYEELQASNQRYRELFEGSTDPIFITDRYGKILLANRQAAEVTGVEAKSLQGKAIQEIHRINLEQLGQNFQNIPRQGNISYESSMVARDHPEKPIEVYVRKVIFEGADCLQWMLRDITERKELDRMRNDLVAMIYHDLRSPLANVVSSLDILSTLVPEGENPSVNTVVKIAVRSTERIQRLVSSLLDIDRLEAGQKITNQVSTNPVQLVLDARDTVKNVIDSKEQAITISQDPDLPEVWVDQDMIRRVLINLVENAAKYSPNQSQIRIWIGRNQAQVQVTIEDQGPGIPAAERDNIFNKYTRLRMTNSPKGMGLGLAFCRLAIQAHGGRIWVESQPGVAGSKFCFTLPVAGLEPAEG